MVRTGRFREDLYYRLRVVQIDVPPLRERREDIGLLASYFLDRVSRAQGRPGMSFSPEAMEVLERYDYPGNVRELENAIEHAVTLAETPIVMPGDLPVMLRVGRLLPDRGTAAVAMTTPVGERDTWSLAEIERDHIQRVLTRHRGNATAAARQLGISRTTLWRKLREYGIARTELTGA